MFGTELTTMVELGAGLVVGTVDAEGRPRGARAWGAWVVDAEARRVRTVMSADDPIVVDNLSTGRAALTAAEVRTLRSVQLKGRVVSVEEPTERDLELTREHTDVFFQEVVATDGNPLELLTTMLPIAMLAIELEIDEQFDQTPGPGAGAMLRAATR